MVALFNVVVCHNVWPLTSGTNVVAGTLAIFIYSRMEKKIKRKGSKGSRPATF